MQRRTQKERREGTIKKLLDAAADCLIELGYYGATVQEISERAGVSQGGLFRHFATREALMVATGEDIGRRLLAHYRKEFEKTRAREDVLPLAIRLVREACRSRINQAWYELSMAARTNENLRRGLRPVAQAYYRDIEALARDLLPELAEKLGDRFPLLVETIIAVYDGESVHRFLVKNPALAEARLELLSVMIEPLTNP